MKITAITAQQKSPNRVNVMVDGAYRFSLDIFQLSELGIKLGSDYTEAELAALETESQFGKVYGRALEYCLMRPHSAKEVREYLRRKSRDTRTKTGAIKKGVPAEVTGRVFDRLQEKGYIDDEKFARFWAETRHVSKGTSQRRLINELRQKGVEAAVIDMVMSGTERNDETELQKVIAKKRARYPDEQKLIQYLLRQGFRYGDIKQSLAARAEPGSPSADD